MKVEAVKSALIESPMWIRRMKHGEFKEYVKSLDKDSVSSSTRMAAICLCKADGSPVYANLDDAMKEIDAWDWQLVRDISDQIIEFCGMNSTARDAEKNS